ncbi:MFS transporter [Halobacteriales archaeon QH_8_64_26]|nr:MAG: MFS transporter [Halobacteriales archaeon QH_8_64_26]
MSRSKTILQSVPTLSGLRREGGGWVIGSVAIGWLLVLGLRFTLPALVPQLKTTFGIDNATAGIAITVVWATYAAMQLPAGMLIERVGERRLLAGSALLTGLSALGFGLAPVFGVFLVVCGLFGFATGLYGPTRATVLSNVYPEHDGAAFGVLLGAGSIGAATVPLAASALIGRVGWQPALALAAPLLGLAGVALWRSLPTHSLAANETTTEASDRSERARAVIRGIARRSVVIVVIGATLMLFVFQGLTAFLPTYLVVAKGLGQASATALFALLFVCGAAFQLAAGAAADRFGDRTVLLTLTTASIVPLALLPFVSGPVLLAAVVLLGARYASAPITNAYVLDVLPDEIQGTAWGSLRTAFFLVGATGSTFVGALADRGFFDEAVLILAALTALAVGVFAVLPPRTAT